MRILDPVVLRQVSYSHNLSSSVTNGAGARAFETLFDESKVLGQMPTESQWATLLQAPDMVELAVEPLLARRLPPLARAHLSFAAHLWHAIAAPADCLTGRPAARVHLQGAPPENSHELGIQADSADAGERASSHPRPAPRSPAS